MTRFWAPVSSKGILLFIEPVEHGPHLDKWALQEGLVHRLAVAVLNQQQLEKQKLLKLQPEAGQALGIAVIGPVDLFQGRGKTGHAPQFEDVLWQGLLDPHRAHGSLQAGRSAWRPLAQAIGVQAKPPQAFRRTVYRVQRRGGLGLLHRDDFGCAMLRPPL